MLDLSVLLLNLLRPGILQRDRAIENELAGPRIRIDREVGETLELVTLVRQSLRERWLAFRVDDLEGVRIKPAFEIAVGIRFRHGEEAIVKADLGVDRLRSTDPVNRAFHLATGGRAACFALQISRAMQLYDVT